MHLAVTPIPAGTMPTDCTAMPIYFAGAVAATSSIIDPYRIGCNCKVHSQHDRSVCPRHVTFLSCWPALSPVRQAATQLRCTEPSRILVRTDLMCGGRVRPALWTKATIRLPAWVLFFLLRRAFAFEMPSAMMFSYVAGCIVRQQETGSTQRTRRRVALTCCPAMQPRAALDQRRPSAA